MMIESQLEDLGHEVVATAARLREALGLARTLDVDFAVLDVNLAGELSYPVAEALQARGVPFFLSPATAPPGCRASSPTPWCCRSHSPRTSWRSRSHE